jgi:hypothetical protein
LLHVSGSALHLQLSWYSLLQSDLHTCVHCVPHTAVSVSPTCRHCIQDLFKAQPRCRKSHARLLLDCLAVSSGLRAAAMLDYEPRLQTTAVSMLCAKLSAAASTAVLVLEWQGSLWIVNLAVLLHKCELELYGGTQSVLQLLLFSKESAGLRVHCQPLRQHSVCFSTSITCVPNQFAADLVPVGCPRVAKVHFQMTCSSKRGMASAWNMTC